MSRRRESDGTSVLHVAALNGHLEIVEYLLEQGADRDHPTNGIQTPLHLAALAGQLKVAQCLMTYGADINVKNSHIGTTCILEPTNKTILKPIIPSKAERVVTTNKISTPKAKPIIAIK